MKLLVCVGMVFLILSGCGQTGGLYLPTEKAASTQKTTIQVQGAAKPSVKKEVKNK
jgi:predicted small lipoprotein YifL